jgi:hypothetical protein
MAGACGKRRGSRRVDASAHLGSDLDRDLLGAVFLCRRGLRLDEGGQQTGALFCTRFTCVQAAGPIS